MTRFPSSSLPFRSLPIRAVSGLSGRDIRGPSGHRRCSPPRLRILRCRNKDLHRLRQRRQHLVRTTPSSSCGKRSRAVSSLQRMSRSRKRRRPPSKAMLMIGQSPDADSAYADAALHGKAHLAAVPGRKAGSQRTRCRRTHCHPAAQRLTKRGRDVSYCPLPRRVRAVHSAGSSTRLELARAVLIGIGVTRTTKIGLRRPPSRTSRYGRSRRSPAKPKPCCTARWKPSPSLHRPPRRYTAPNIRSPQLDPDGASLIFNSKGRLKKIPGHGRQPETIDTGFAVRCNNDHGISPDGTMLAISDQSRDERQSLIYIDADRRRTSRGDHEIGPSYWHGWSPDGKTLAFSASATASSTSTPSPSQAERKPASQPRKGWTTDPNTRPTGKYIYFNSERTGRMQIWRMKPDGSARNRSPYDEYNNWFPHISPDGKWLVFHHLRKRRHRPPGKQKRHAPHDDARRRQDARAREAIRRPGNDQRALMVAGQQASLLCQLRAAAVAPDRTAVV